MNQEKRNNIFGQAAGEIKFPLVFYIKITEEDVLPLVLLSATTNKQTAAKPSCGSQVSLQIRAHLQ